MVGGRDAGGRAQAERDAAAVQPISMVADPTTDPEFMKKREALAHVLGAVSRTTRSAFAEGWGLAVMATLSNGAAKLSMDIGWNSQTRHYQNRQALSAGAQPG